MKRCAGVYTEEEGTDHRRQEVTLLNLPLFSSLIDVQVKCQRTQLGFHYFKIFKYI